MMIRFSITEGVFLSPVKTTKPITMRKKKEAAPMTKTTC